MPPTAASESHHSTARAREASRRVIRGGYPFTYEKALQMATVIAQRAGWHPPCDVDDVGGILNCVNDIFDGYDIDLIRILNKNDPDGRPSSYFLATTPRRPANLSEEELERAEKELHYWDPSVQLKETDTDRFVKQLIKDETGVEGGPFHTVIWPLGS
ncbi:hypothetical protein OH77DRAFT_1431308 [Trametes cingulata]|nr:hypothetical protein OH77DRAFT_1431308 [Trametes cingulata]